MSKWGILGTGKIARRFMQAMSYVPDAEVVAVGSRSLETAKQFGRQFGIPNCYGSYEDVLHDPAVEVVYIATPHNLHAENTLATLQAGKHVLCEKPFAVNAKQAEQVIQLARQTNRFVMEGMWTRCFPVMQEVVRRVRDGQIGTVRYLQADFGFQPPFNPESRLFSPHLAGGALLDVGIYPIAFAFQFLGEPSQVVSTVTCGQTGVDELEGILLRYDSGAIAVLSASIQVNTPRQAFLCGTKGMVHFPAPWWKPSEAFWVRPDGTQEHLLYPYEGDGLQFEIRHVQACLQQGKHESPLMPLEESLRILRLMDRLRAEWGVRYPFEE